MRGCVGSEGVVCTAVRREDDRESALGRAREGRGDGVG